MTGNTSLLAAMRELGLTHRELAERVNEEIAARTGRRGSVSEGSVGRWANGATAWPHARQRLALEAVFGCSATALGFVPRARGSTGKGVDVDRRTFLTTTTASVAPATRLTIGDGDVERLRLELARLTTADDLHGGTTGIETRALTLARHTLDLQQAGSASQRIRGRLYGLGASYVSSAMWAAVDARETGRARRYLERAAYLAGLSGDREVQWRIWSHTALLALQQKRPAEASAAAEAARANPINRRSATFRALSHARSAGIHAAAGDRTAALRSHEHAHRAAALIERDEPLPSWMRFFDAAELAGLDAVMFLRLGHADAAEAGTHRALALLRPGLHRNRGYYTAHLALAQLAQGDLDQACATLDRVAAGRPVAGRTGDLVRRFRRELLAAAPDADQTREWLTRQRDIRDQE